ncbi:hypothetical protein CC85DRAFT_95907 [Cutaneotrichosporon oleaginosum]|uniref:Uncharacterized protein n=1 Tax=Cutaneotrichosporon oleaginosum TaxID=879819 RepID=A0A0J0XME2_9TREE|nr:uncharacterized protein CC85DRAFT_95907 [Cutaneotrichosporon oleaginosum]KLT42305.1 hypothetical protein CC85DRAFT_95907 [Cutaneotrichosporon oleaginosum]TXT11477.1 hypothetical protein COLE_01887 [Cutaneotrichosporon oleaginosum]
MLPTSLVILPLGIPAELLSAQLPSRSPPICRSPPCAQSDHPINNVYTAHSLLFCMLHAAYYMLRVVTVASDMLRNTIILLIVER